MADGVERKTKFLEAALVLANDASENSARLRRYIRGGQYDKAEALAGDLQKTARDAKWLIRRLPKRD
jgi:hypothetical protein